CGWTSAYIAGCSMGGMVAQGFGTAYPKRALGLALIDTTATYGAGAAQAWAERAAKAETDGFAAMADFQFSRWFSDQYKASHPAEVKALLEVFVANTVGCYQDSCGLLSSTDLTGAIRSLRIPVSVIVGEEDYATPVAMSQTIHELIPGSTLQIMPGARHLTPL